MKRSIATVLAVFLTLAVLRMLFKVVHLETLTDSLRAANMYLALLAFLLFGVTQWIRAWRFSLLTTGSFALPAWPYMSVAFRLNMLNFIIPFRVGELGYPILMHRDIGQPYAEAVGVLIVARIYDLAVVSALIIIFSVWFKLFAPALQPVAAVAALLLPLSALVIVTAVRRGLHARLAKGWLARKLTELSRGLDRAGSFKSQCNTLLLTSLVWLTFGVAASIAARAVTDEISLAASMYGAAAANLAFAFPVNGIAGLGTSQAAWVLAANYAGTEMEPAITSAMMAYLISLASAIVGGGTCFILSLRPAPTKRP